eukprot:5168061-Lingulodinium_polyedra.AAC.1
MERAKRAICEALRLRTVDSTATLCTVVETVRNDAVESAVCHRNGSQIARVTHSMRTPCFGVRMECASRAICEGYNGSHITRLAHFTRRPPL